MATATNLSNNTDLYRKNIDTIMNQYKGGVIFGEQINKMKLGTKYINHGFMGSYDRVFVQAGISIFCKSPGCFAAQEVELFSKQTIALGIEKSDGPVPVRIYAPEKLIITTDHLRVGDLELLEKNVDTAIVACKKFTVYKQDPTDLDSDTIELLRSWLLFDSTDVQYTTFNCDS